MPPKPWQKRGVAPAHNISQIIQSNPTVKQQVPKVNTDAPLQGTTTNNDPNNPTSTAYNSMSGGLGTGLGIGSSMYGGSGYGGYGGGYGMGGYGMGGLGMGGLGMGMGMYGGGMGMMGMGMGMDQNSTLFNSMIALQSFGFLINSLSDIARSLDQNYQGLQLFKSSFKSFSSKVQNGVKDGAVGVGVSAKNSAISFIEFIKKYILCMGKRDEKEKLRSVRIIMAIAIFIFVISFYPLLKRYLKGRK